MRICFLQDDFPPQSFGGAGIVAFNLAKLLQKMGHQIFIITTTQNRSEENNINFDGLTIFRIYSNYQRRWRAYLSLYNPQTVHKVKSIISEIKPDIIHCHNIHYYLSYHCLKISKESKAGVFLTAHDTMLFHYGKAVSSLKGNNYKITPWLLIKRYKKWYNPFRNLIIRYYLKYIDKIFAVSQSLKNALSDNGIKNAEVIYNGIDVKDWEIGPKEIAEFKREYNIENKKIIFFGGRLSDLKGGEKIILSMKKVVQEIPQAVLLIAGRKDNYTEKILSLAKKLSIENKIIFISWLSGDKLKAVYGASNLVVVPSIYLDPFPTINLEAMASKKPVIATCFGGSSEVVLDQQTGYIVNPLNTEMMAEKIIDLLKNPEKAEKFGQAGYQRVKEKFSLNKQTEKILKYYQGALKK